MKLSLNSSNLYSFFQKHVSLLLALSLVAVILLEAMVINRSVDFVTRVRNQVPNVQTRIVRVNIPMYTEVEKKLEENAQFEASNPPVQSPFGLAPLKTK
jgi:ssDNA-binding replication factor A large subunit